MEVLSKMQDIQTELEDALRLEIEYAEVKETRDGKKLLSYLRRRRRVVNRIVNILNRF